MSACISREGKYSKHTPDADYVCTLCGVLDEERLIAELHTLREERDEHAVELNRLRAFMVTCSCSTGPMTFEGPEADCPVHGAVRAYNETAAERDALRVGVQKIIDYWTSPFATDSVASLGRELLSHLRKLLDYTSITGE